MALVSGNGSTATATSNTTNTGWIRDADVEAAGAVSLRVTGKTATDAKVVSSISMSAVSADIVVVAAKATDTAKAFIGGNTYVKGSSVTVAAENNTVLDGVSWALGSFTILGGAGVVVTNTVNNTTEAWIDADAAVEATDGTGSVGVSADNNVDVTAKSDDGISISLAKVGVSYILNTVTTNTGAHIDGTVVSEGAISLISQDTVNGT